MLQVSKRITSQLIVYFMLSLIMLVIYATTAQAYTRTYQQNLKGDTFTNIWKIATTNETVTINGTIKSAQVKLESHHPFHTHTFSYKYTDGNTDFKVKRIGNELQIKGKVRGKTFDDFVSIGKEPWIQLPALQLKPFIKGPHQSQKFWVVSTDTGHVVKLVVYKENIETIKIGNDTWEALKVKMTLPDIRGLFWSTWFWFDTETGHSLQFKGLAGPPGSPETTIRLVPNL